ncbi:hypothetical protein ABZU25_27805 [Micromonospora sp. NPDC005215]|uniref:hypothetical protein n=1 Tax=Micromonospora sp. NPDC005215 TaxID=3157024 RepID=UPI00339E07E6
MDDDRKAISQRVEAQMGVRPPEALLDVWTGVRPVDDEGDVYIYGPDEIADRNLAYEVPEYAPGLLLIGSDGGGDGLFVATNDPDPEVVLIDLGAVGTSDGRRAGRLSVLAAEGFRSINSAEDARIEPAAGPIDVLVTHRPGVKALVEIRKLFHLSLPISALTAADAHYPMVVLTDVYYGKYAEAINQVNLRYECLAVRPHVAA